jgi:hypothetical protein
MVVGQIARDIVLQVDSREAELLTGQPVRSGRDAVAAGRELLRHGRPW